MRISDALVLIERFVHTPELLKEWEWDDFLSIDTGDQKIDELREKVMQIEIDYPISLEDPPNSNNSWCSATGMSKLAELINTY